MTVSHLTSQVISLTLDLPRLKRNGTVAVIGLSNRDSVCITRTVGSFETAKIASTQALNMFWSAHVVQSLIPSPPLGKSSDATYNTRNGNTSTKTVGPSASLGTGALLYIRTVGCIAARVAVGQLIELQTPF